MEGLDLLGGAGSLGMGMVKGHTQDPSLALELKVCLCARDGAGSRRTGSHDLLEILESHLISLRLNFIPCPMRVMESKPLPSGVFS